MSIFKERKESLIFFPGQKHGAQVLRLLDFLIETPIEAFLLSRRGAIPVQVSFI